MQFFLKGRGFYYIQMEAPKKEDIMAKLKEYYGKTLLEIEGGKIKEYYGKTLYEIDGDKAKEY